MSEHWQVIIDKVMELLRENAKLQAELELEREQRKKEMKNFALLALEWLDALERVTLNGNYVSVKAIQIMMLSKLRHLGITKMDINLGSQFDPVLHRAVEVMDTVDKDGTVVSVVKDGYLMNGEILREAEVVVSRINISNEEPEVEIDWVEF